jgi:uncharacterized tellurite resistance protein B-like protein
MGLFDFVKEIATEVAMDTARDIMNKPKQNSNVQKHKDAVQNIDGRMVSLSPQGALLLASSLIMSAGINESSRLREEYRVYSIDRKNGFSIDLKEALAITRIDFSSVEELFDYCVNLIAQTLRTKDERLTLIANILDIAMVDGEIDEEEWARIGLFMEALDVDEDIVKTIYAVLEIKNKQLSAKQ